MKSSNADRVAFAIAVCLLLLGAVNAVSRFPTAYDFLVFHLPAALTLVGRTTFVPPQFAADIIAGHPPLAHAVMGGLIFLTGHASAAAWIGLLGLAGFVGGFRWLTGEMSQTRWLLLSSLAVPLVAVDLYVPYLDLWTASWLALALFAAVRSARRGPTHREAAMFALSTTAAAWSDFHAWSVVAVLILWISAHWVVAARALDGPSRRLIALALTATALGAAAWPAYNFHRFGHLTHPTESLRASPQDDMPDLLRGVPQPVRFAASVFETGRLWESRIRYSNDMWDQREAMPLQQQPDFHSENANHRVGGWGVWTVALIIAWWIHWWRRGDPMARRTLGLFLLLLLLIAPLAHSHELRFSLGLPLGALACLGHYDEEFVRVRWRTLLLCLALTLAHVIPTLIAPGGDSVERVAPPAARAFWSRAKPGVIYSLPAHEMPVFWAGPDFRSFIVRPEGAVSPEAPR